MEFRRVLFRSWWVVVILALAIGVVQSTITVLPPGAEVRAQPWPGPMTLVMGLAMIAACGIAFDGLRQRFAGQSFTLGQPLAAIGLVAAALTPIAAAVRWIPAHDDVVQRAPRRDVPAFVAAEADGPQPPVGPSGEWGKSVAVGVAGSTEQKQ